MPLLTLPEDLAALKKLTLFAAEDREGFRLNAQKALAAYTPSDRALVNKLCAPHLTAYDVCATWKTRLLPLATELDAQLATPTFHRALSKHLLLDEPTALHTASELVNDRLQATREQLLQELYPLTGKKDGLSRQRQTARQLFTLPLADVDSFSTRYTASLLHKEVAVLHSIDVLDSHISWWQRRKTAHRIKRERKQTIRQEDVRLQSIEQRRVELQGSYDNLMGTITGKGWDLITIIGLRQLYEKQLKHLSDMDASKHLALFNKITKTFRTRHLESLSPTQLFAAHALDNEASALLLHIFQLSTPDKNQLLLISKELRELTDEKENILKARTHREKILQELA